MHKRKFNPGFRLSVIDISFIGIGLISSFFLRQTSPELSYVVLFVVGQFFVFCNIVRMSRKSELIWAVCFTVLCSVSLAYDFITLRIVFAMSCSITILLIALELRKPSYHGVFWSKINPKLKIWFERIATGGEV